MKKKEIRERIIKLRLEMSDDEVREKSARVASRVVALPVFQQAETVMSYVAFRNEVETGGIIRTCLAQGKRVVVPVTDRANKRLIPSEVKKFPDDLKPGTWGILEPKAECFRPVEPEVIDLVLVPGVGFDIYGNRLGYGGGFYDRFLPRLSPEATTVALAYQEQLLPDVFPEAHDHPVDFVVTDREVINCRENRLKINFTGKLS
ncbi:5-formyltetrahydrofolate cyclo-ligase [Calderihabitans maritimus]|uniref:5-formyltetrahydrofolate cyclo-ligase n=1 Tax=Calderihabitans maritimus TaxID=1246530 RepID=A0A1Z5HS45_9FIRM|nr:5-formyltetrahydrofolate cyclo-ligase [Calderihabitans maritimus]GAW92187.1 5-formyltetrahydrofolate cyclo-ligase [Calderihabitans maritimus]